MNCCIFGAGDYRGEGLLWTKDAFVIAADGGLMHLERYGILPNLAVGDFDSLGRLPQGVEALRFPVMKDDTDMALAVEEGILRGCDRFFLFGGMGGRLDHTLANMALLLNLEKRGFEAYLVGEGCVITALSEKKGLTFSESCEGMLSVFSAEAFSEGVTLSGLFYPLEKGRLTNDKALGVSNHFLGQKADVSLEKGSLYLVWDTLKNPLPERYIKG